MADENSGDKEGQKKKMPLVPRGGGGKRRGNLPPMPKMPKQLGSGDSFWVNLAISVLVLLVLAGAYSYFATTTQTPNIPISQVASDISAGKVSSIDVNGD